MKSYSAYGPKLGEVKIPPKGPLGDQGGPKGLGPPNEEFVVFYEKKILFWVDVI